MTASATEQMEFKDEENQTSKTGEAPQSAAGEEGFSGELDAARWSVMSFEEVAMRGLSYEEAARWLDKLRSQNVHGLCIVTDEAASRFSRKS